MLVKSHFLPKKVTIAAFQILSRQIVCIYEWTVKVYLDETDGFSVPRAGLITLFKLTAPFSGMLSAAQTVCQHILSQLTWICHHMATQTQQKVPTKMWYIWIKKHFSALCPLQGISVSTEEFFLLASDSYGGVNSCWSVTVIPELGLKVLKI